jgi:hypothetical protein
MTTVTTRLSSKAVFRQPPRAVAIRWAAVAVLGIFWSLEEQQRSCFCSRRGLCLGCTSCAFSMDYSSLVFSFGKHNGKTVAEVIEQDKQYIFYIAGKGASFKMRGWMQREQPEFYKILNEYCVAENIDFPDPKPSTQTFIRNPRKWA